MTDEETIDFQDRTFTCPYCGKETIMGLPPEMERVIMGRTICDECDREFLIENDVPRPLPQ
jgi:transcription elongation factor Elf1